MTELETLLLQALREQQAQHGQQIEQMAAQHQAQIERLSAQQTQLAQQLQQLSALVELLSKRFDKL